VTAAREYLEGVLADLEAEAARVRAALADLGTESRPCPTADRTECPAGSPSSSAAEAGPVQPGSTREKLLGLLASGPARSGWLAEQLGLTQQAVRFCLRKYPEFQQQDGNRFALWQLRPAPCPAGGPPNPEPAGAQTPT
jgi:hypothetical protein